MSMTSVTTDNVAQGGVSYGRVGGLSDDELLASTRRLVGRSNQILAALLAHLAEVETRGLHRSKACSSLYTYCVYELRFSEDAASRRVCAARFVKRFPALLEAVANGELHLTGLLMLGPHLTSQNQLELLARAKFRTKKELSTLVRILDPLPDVPAQIICLGPPTAPMNANPSWQSFAASFCPVRELSPRERPGSWAGGPLTDRGSVSEAVAENLLSNSKSETAALAREASHCFETAALAREGSYCVETAALAREASHCVETAALAREGSYCVETAALAREASHCVETAALAREGSYCVETAALAREASRCVETAALAREASRCVETAALARDVSGSIGEASGAMAREEVLAAPQRYQVQFMAGEEHVQLVERAKDLLSAGRSRIGLADIHLRAMRMLVAALEKRKYGAARCSPRGEGAKPANSGGPPQIAEPSPSSEERGRYIPAAERRAVYERDGARCSYVDGRGQRCRETSGLELHHLVPFARNGAHVSVNLALFCRAHNTLAAEQDFGRRHVERKREEVAHESWRTQEPV